MGCTRRFAGSTSAIVLIVIGAAAAIKADVVPVHHSTTINGAKIDYDAALDTFPVSEPGHAPGATITTLSYVRAGTATAGNLGRPLVFAFNGGPGGPSIFLNVGMLGPERIELPADVKAPAQARYPLVRNDDSILDIADVVLIDPVGTGFSRLTDEKARSYFYSVSGDAAAVANVIQTWSRMHGRSASAKYVLGVSYGAVRCVEVAENLLKDPETAGTVAGIIFVSPSLAIIDTISRRSNILGQVIGLPMMAAVSWYYKRAGQGENLPDFAARAEAFAGGEWLPALFAGTALPDAKRRSVAGGLASFTGLPAKYFLDHDLHLSKAEYRRLLFADRGLILGEDDARYAAPAALGRDPFGVLEDAMPVAVADVLQSEFGIHDATNYHLYVPIRDWIYVRQPFDIYNRDDYAQLDYMGDLMKAMAENPNLRIFIGGGWFDTTASAGAQDYQVTRDGLDLKRVTARHYFGGHVFFTNPDSRIQFGKDLHLFISRPL